MTTATLTRPKSVARTAETLDERILRILKEKGAASAEVLAKALARELGAPVDVATVGAACEGLVRRRAIHVLRSDDLEALRVLDRNRGGVTTPELTAKLGWNRRRAYERCRRIERRIGLLSSEARPSRGFLYFFPVTGQILTRTTYPQIQKVIEDLKAIAYGIGITPGTKIPEPLKLVLIEAYRRYFEALRKGKSNRIREQITAFERQLMAVLRGNTLSDVLGLFGVRPFRPRIREWRLTRGARRRRLIYAVIHLIRKDSRLAGNLPGNVYVPRLSVEEAAGGDRGDARAGRDARATTGNRTTPAEKRESAA